MSEKTRVAIHGAGGRMGQRPHGGHPPDVPTGPQHLVPIRMNRRVPFRVEGDPRRRGAVGDVFDDRLFQPVGGSKPEN